MIFINFLLYLGFFLSTMTTSLRYFVTVTAVTAIKIKDYEELMMMNDKQHQAPVSVLTGSRSDSCFSAMRLNGQASNIEP